LAALAEVLVIRGPVRLLRRSGKANIGH
jgi:hypothetical protein